MPLINARLLKFARDMRHEGAPAELRLWRCLRNRQLNDYKFRRQRPIDRFVVDFVCIEQRLIIELDGESHEVRLAYDASRTTILNRYGYDVVRFSNADVFENLEGVLNAILELLEEKNTPSPLPSPRSTAERW